VECCNFPQCGLGLWDGALAEIEFGALKLLNITSVFIFWESTDQIGTFCAVQTSACVLPGKLGSGPPGPFIGYATDSFLSPSPSLSVCACLSRR